MPRNNPPHTEPNVSERNAETPLHSRMSSMSKQWLVVFSGKVSQQIFGFITGVLIAKVLGSAALGHYQLSMVIVHLLANITIMGTDRGLIRYIPIFQKHQPGKAKRVIYSSLGISFFISLILTLILFLGAPFIAATFFDNKTFATALRIFAFYLPAFTLWRLLVAVFDGFKRADIETPIQNIVTPAIFVLLLVGISLVNPALTPVIWARITAYSLACVLLAFLAWRTFKPLFLAKSQSIDLRAYYAFSAPLLLISTLHLLMNHVDILLTGIYMTDSDVGIYTIAQRMAILSLLGLQAINIIFAPHISELFSDNKLQDMARLFKLFTRWIFIFSLLVFAFYIVFKKQLLSFFGTEFLAGQTALMLLSFGQMINALGGPNGTILIMTGKQKWMLLNSVLMLILNVIFNMLFIPRWGISGAALGTGLSIIIINVLKTAQLYYELRIHPYNTVYLKSTAIIAVATGIAWLMQQVVQFQGLGGAIIGGLVFLVLCIMGYWLFGQNEDDKIIIEFMRQKLKKGR